MNDRVVIPAAQIAPGTAALLRANGVPDGVAVRDKVMALVGRAIDRVGALGEVVGLLVELDVEAFDDIYRAALDNAEPAPLAGIYPRAARLALFVVTLGEAISEEIQVGFATNDFAYASMLDTAASLAAESAVGVLEQRLEAASADSGLRVLSYSPGYCGWHLSGQRSLFARLGPERIGVRLDTSFLMKPLKSVSGVLVAAAPADHDFANAFEFCQLCRTKNCRERLGRLLHAAPGAGE